MHFPTAPTDAAPSFTPLTLPGGNLSDPPPLVTDEQRETDFNRPFAWRGQEINFSIFSEIYYRELRTLMNAPPLGDYITEADFGAEAPRVVYCAALTQPQMRALRLKSAERQIEAFDQWVEKNIAFHELDRIIGLAQQINVVANRARTQMTAGDEALDSLGN